MNSSLERCNSRFRLSRWLAKRLWSVNSVNSELASAVTIKSGKLTIDKGFKGSGELTVTVKANEGYMALGASATREDTLEGIPVQFANNGASFTMPASEVDIEAAIRNVKVGR